MKLICNINLFSLNQIIYCSNYETVTPIAEVTLEDLPATVAAICAEKRIANVVLTGNSVYGETVADDIRTYALKNYNKNDIIVEVQ